MPAGGSWAGGYLYIGGLCQGFAGKKGVHRPLKKTVFFVILAFDLAGPRSYNPRPRCFAADVAKR